MAIASCRRRPGVVGLRDVRYGYEGDNHFDEVKDVVEPVFHL